MKTLFGLVLAGGKSSRMGMDKSLIQYHNVPQRDYVYNLLSEFCEKVFVSCNNEQTVPLEFNPLHDSLDIKGPLNGIISAMLSARDKAWLITAVDMPNINRSVLKTLIAGRDQSKLATCFRNPVEQFPEPLLTIWEPNALSHLEKFVESGSFSPREFLKTHDVEQLDVESSVLMNINSRDELEAFRKRQTDN